MSWFEEGINKLYVTITGVGSLSYLIRFLQLIFLGLGMMTLAMPAFASSTTGVNGPSRYLFRFDAEPVLDGWNSIDDVVMGGQSSSALAIADGALVFSGHVSLANNGGFASVRSAVLEPSFADAKAIILRVMGDGKGYKLNLKTDASLDGIQYQARFRPGAGVWETVRLPFARFVATYRGRRVAEAPPLRIAEIRTVGLMISERQAGPFELKVEWIGVELGVPSRTAKDR